MRPSPSINPSPAPAASADHHHPEDSAPASEAGEAIQVSYEELLAIHHKFRAVKHSACNALAVIMALSEMAERNPAYVEKLTQAVLAKSPQMVSELRAFDDEFRALLKAQPE